MEVGNRKWKVGSGKCEVITRKEKVGNRKMGVGNIKREIGRGKYRVVLITGPPLNFLSTGSNANWPRIFQSFSSHKGILYFENLGGDQLKEPSCRKKEVDREK